MKNILFFNGKAIYPWRWGLKAEALKILQEDSENELFALDCNKCVDGYCWRDNRRNRFDCRKCIQMNRIVAQEAGVKHKNLLKLKRIKSPKFPNFKNIQEALNFRYEGYELGLGPVSTLMSNTRDYNFNIFWANRYLKKHMHAVYTVIKNLEELHEKYHFDEIHTFNGRLTIQYAAISFAKKHNLSYTIYDRGANINKIEIIKDEWLHDFYLKKRNIKSYWENASDDKYEKAIQWFNDRRDRKYQSFASFCLKQEVGLLPSKYDKDKEKIVFFNSSIDEINAFESWKHPFAKNENEVIEKILEHYKNDKTKHFYLRVHPNLGEAKIKKTSQIREINKLARKYKNLTVIEPDNKIDSYALIEFADKVLTSYSSIGCEANYYGKPVIIAGKSIYEDLDCAYKANNYDELFELIETKDLKPKPKENSYPFGYYFQTFGRDCKYFISTYSNKGYFLGKAFWYINRATFKTFKKMLKLELLIQKNLWF